MPKTRKTPITRIREERGLSQYALAKRIGIAQSHLRDIELGSEPRVRLAIRIAQELGVSERELFPKKSAVA